MAKQPHRNLAPVPIDGGVSQTSGPAPSPTQALARRDANGFDPAEFEWRPVPRRPRKDGWTPEMQQEFIRALARTGSVERACEEVGLSVRSAYNLRNAQGGEDFARAWAHVLTRAADRLLDVAFEQAIVGEEIPVYDQDGVRTGVRWKYNTRMAMFLLRAYHPDRFRHAHKDVRHADEAPLPAAMPVAAAVASLAPVTPDAPHQLMPPGCGWLIDDAREDAARFAADPPDDRERWQPQPVPVTPVRVHERAQRRRSTRNRREEREGESNRGEVE